MEKKVKAFILIDVLVLLLLLLASSTDLLIKEKEPEVYKIAVMVDMPAKELHDNFRAGMQKASELHENSRAGLRKPAGKYHIDMNFIDLASVETAAEKLSILQRELKNGCQGIVLHCEKEVHVAEILKYVPVNMPVVLYNVESEAACIVGRINSDIEKECTLLQKAILRDKDRRKGVTIVDSREETDRAKLLHDMLEERLKKSGISVQRLHLASMKGAHELIREASRFGGGVFVSADLNMMQVLGETNLACGKKLSVYGAGFHAGIQKLLEEGGIQATVVHRSYEAGNFSLEMILKALRNIEIPKKKVVLESALVTAENMYTVEVESIIFPHI